MRTALVTGGSRGIGLEVCRRLGTVDVDVLVNNAAVLLGEDDSVLTAPPEHFRRSMETNAYGPLGLCQALMPGMLRRRYGRIVNVSSGAGQLAGMTD